MPATARKICRRRVVGAWQGPIAHAITIDISVTAKIAPPIEILLAEHFSAFDWFLRVGEWIRHPVVHAEIEVRHDEDRSLKMFSKVEGVLSHREALFDRARHQYDVLGISVAKNCVRQNVALRRARGQTRRRSNTLNVPNHSRNFRVVSQTCKLGHQRNSRPGRGSHSASSRPTRTHYHTDRGQFIFR